MGGNNEFFENFERNKYLKKLPSMQRVNMMSIYIRKCFEQTKIWSYMTEGRLIQGVAKADLTVPNLPSVQF